MPDHDHRVPGRRLARFAAALPAFLLFGASVPADRSCAISDRPVLVPAGMVALGEDGPDRAGRPVEVPAFRIDRHEVTNRQFAAFVAATGHLTQAEREGGSPIFVQPAHPVSLDDPTGWWRMAKGADWRHPFGPGSDIEGKADQPVVHVSRDDAEAYARWAGGFLPSEAQWERAARGRQDGSVTPARWAFDEDGRARANVWEGVFPMRDTGDDGYAGIAPVGCFASNDFGLYDMVGNVWEWVGCDENVGLVKGGSYLCAMNYCANFRPAGFQAQERDLGTSHIGFRLAYPANPSSPRKRKG